VGGEWRENIQDAGDGFGNRAPDPNPNPNPSAPAINLGVWISWNPRVSSASRNSWMGGWMDG